MGTQALQVARVVAQCSPDTSGLCEILAKLFADHMPLRCGVCGFMMASCHCKGDVDMYTSSTW